LPKSTLKKALVTGVTGQDGAYLAALLLEKGYEVYGFNRRASSSNTSRLEKLNILENPSFYLLHGDMTDTSSIMKTLREVQPDEIYNLAAQSHVAVSFESPEYTANSDALGVLRILEAIKTLGLSEKTKFYQASTSELFGLTQAVPQNEKTPFYPRSPYGVAKLYGYWISVNYREAHGIFASNGILFNHESPLRGDDFVTKKISRALCEIKLGLRTTLHLGNLDAKRDWGHARDYVEAQWLILQHSQPDDFVIATGRQHSVRNFVEFAAKELGFVISWEGAHENEKGYDQSGRSIIEVNPAFYRPTEVESLIGDPSKANKLLGWSSNCTFEELVQEMVREDMEELQNG